MDIYIIDPHRVTQTTDAESEIPPQEFLWLDATHDEVAADPGAWRDKIERITSIHIYDLHLADATNLSHPSYFDSTQDYAMVVFRKLDLASLAWKKTKNVAQSMPEEKYHLH